jgi:peptidylprolyl isomerase
MVVAGFDGIEDPSDELGAEPILFVDCGCGGGVERIGFERGGDFLALAHDPHPFSTLGRLLLSERVWRKRPCPPKSAVCSDMERTMADDRLTLSLSTGGDVVIKLRPDLAPDHVERITTLANQGFYDGVLFHRVIPGFMAQGGDPTGTGFHGSDLPNLQAEFSDEPHVRGTCSMARAQNPDSANSQFFICFDDARFLDGQYTVWGEVESGMEHVDALPKGEPPANPGKIEKAKVG